MEEAENSISLPWKLTQIIKWLTAIATTSKLMSTGVDARQQADSTG